MAPSASVDISGSQEAIAQPCNKLTTTRDDVFFRSQSYKFRSPKRALPLFQWRHPQSAPKAPIEYRLVDDFRRGATMKGSTVSGAKKTARSIRPIAAIAVLALVGVASARELPWPTKAA